MRTIEEIKKEITSAWMHDEVLAKAYGYEVGSEWKFSRVSVENVLCYIVATALWLHERLFEVHREEVETYIAAMKPHTLRWWVEKSKRFQLGSELPEDSCEYDNSGLDEEELAKRQIVKFAAATEQRNIVYLKVAKDAGGEKQPLDESERSAFESYVDEVRDAGVSVEVISEAGCRLQLELTIYYDPMLLDKEGKHLAYGTKPVEEAIKQYIENLPFNGEYRNSELVDRLQEVEGVVIPELESASERMTDESKWKPIAAYSTPYSGYYAYEAKNIKIDYKEYERATN